MKKEIIKPFDLEAYENGAKVKTRNDHEVTMHYTSKGEIDAGDISDNDLVIVEEVEEPEFWTDKENRTADGYFIDSDSSIAYCPYVYYNQDYYKNFADRKQAISAMAMARISQIMANDVEHFGGAITDEEWKERAVRKYCVYRTNNKIRTVYAYSDYYFLAFHTEEQMNLFLNKYRDLVREYLMLD